MESRELTDFEEIVLKIKEERTRQDEKWGLQDHSDLEWYAILGEEFGEVGQALCKTQVAPINPKEFLKFTPEVELELIQSASVIFAWLECIEQNKQ